MLNTNFDINLTNFNWNGLFLGTQENYSIVGNGAINFIGGDLGNNFFSEQTDNNFANGESENDTIAEDDSLFGSVKNEFLYSGMGHDINNGGMGNDTIFRGEGNDNVMGGGGNDFIKGGDDNDTLKGENDNDTLFGEHGDDYLIGGRGNDFLKAGIGNDTLNGGQHNDTLNGETGNDFLMGRTGEDFIMGGDGNDTIKGGKDNDTLQGGYGEDSLVGGMGNDFLLSRSDAGEPEIAQQTTVSKVYPDQPFMATDDTLFGGEGADIFLFEILLNAKPEIMAKHADFWGNINWRGVAGENNNVHDHWVEGVGNDVVLDFDREEGDKLNFIGHTLNTNIEYAIDSNGTEYSIINLFSNQGGAGSHDGDLLGTVSVYGDTVVQSDLGIDGMAFSAVYQNINEVKNL